jgi:hypothetical protein
MVALLRGHNNLGPKSVGVVASILALPILPVGWIHAVGKTFHPLVWLAVLYCIVLLFILQFIFLHSYLMILIHTCLLILYFSLLPHAKPYWVRASRDAVLQPYWIVYNKWLQQSGNWGNDLYVATVDDLVRALIQLSRYYQFLKGKHAGTGPGEEELILRVAQHSALRLGNPKALNVAMAKMHGAHEFCTRKPHFEVEEVFGSQKHKVDISLGSEHESHRPDRVNFSCPWVRTRSTAAVGASCNLSEIPKKPSPNL